ncbi:MAG: metallophosphoesterase family protein [Alphaproteobacteria bacterium]|nr:metallophosphoesterase family protein [Alphaproteobacteria bacterium]
MNDQASTPSNHRIYVVGDIHGRLDLLTRLLAMVEADAIQHESKIKKLVFLGDYIDRGLDSRGVLERLTKPFAERMEPLFLRGNHDDRMVRFLDGHFEVVSSWLQYGGIATFASYGVNATAGIPQSKLPALREELKAKVPAAHQDFLNSTLFAASFGDYYFVHAGVNPTLDLEEQRPADQMWIRDVFLDSPVDFGKIIVHGHTIVAEPENRPNRIAIDTGAFASGTLTCLVLDGAERSFFTT